MQGYHKHFSTRKTPQTEPIPGTDQTEMRSGGFGWEVDDWVRLDRFLVMGTEGGTYYVRESKLTRANAEAVLRCLKADGPRTVARIAEISDSGRAPKNDPALFALAMCAKLGNAETAQAAYRVLPKVARIGTHLFHFAEYVKAFGGLGGSGFKRAIGRWYTEKRADKLAYQAVKYQQRDGWSHRDLLRLAHPRAQNDDQQSIFRWITQGNVPEATSGMETIYGFEYIKKATSPRKAAQLISDYRLPHEAVPNEFKSDPVVWEALLPNMPPMALLRNLNKLTAVGLVTNTSDAARHIISVFSDQERLVKARLHPFSILVGMKTYSMGRGMRGSLTWEPAGRVVDVLDKAFYLAFKAVEPTGKRLCLGLDVSGSMCSQVSGLPISCREAVGALALVTANVEDMYEMVGFTSGGPGFVQMTNRSRGYWGGGGSGITPLTLSPRMRLDQAADYMAGLPFGGTDCALPILWALANNIKIDAFVTMTDNESWAGDIHADQALKMYRDKMGIPAKLVAVAMTTDKYSVANPNDAGQLDVVGLDTATPNVISDFIRN